MGSRMSIEPKRDMVSATTRSSSSGLVRSAGSASGVIADLLRHRVQPLGRAADQRNAHSFGRGTALAMARPIPELAAGDQGHLARQILSHEASPP